MSRPFHPMTMPLAGVQLIEASAGTGKTYSITSLYLRLLLTRRLGVEQILVVTFTEAATAELHERVRSRLQAAIHAFASGNFEGDQVVAALLAESRDQGADLLLLRQALTGIDEAAITTIHGFCHRMLQRGAFESGIPFDFELVGQVEPLLLEMLHDFLANLSHNEEPRLVALFHEALGKEDLLNLEREAVRHREFPVATPPFAAERGQLLAQAQAEFAAARKLWQAESAAISSSCPPAIFLKELREKISNGLFDRLNDYLAGAAPPAFIVPAGSELLTTDAFLGNGCKSVCSAKAIKNNEVPRHPFFESWQRYVAAVKALRDEFIATTLRWLIDYARAELPRRLYRDQAQSFDDLLHGLDRALAGPGGPVLAALIRGSYPVALIDEFQDTDPVQYRIFQAIYGGAAGNTGLFLIGDPKQAIYAFRGADIFAYLKAAGDAGEQCHTMTTNWRADDALVGAVNRLFEGVVGPFLDARINFSPVSGAHPEPRWQGQGRWQSPLQFLALPPEGANRISSTAAEAMMPKLVAADIVRLLDSDTRIAGRPLRPADIAVLVHKNEQATEMQQALHRHGVAAVLHSRASVFASHEARELLLLLWAAAEPSEAVRLRSALVTDYLGLSAEALLRLDSDEAAFQEWLDRFGRWHLLWRDHGFLRFMGQFREEGGVAARLVRYDDGLRRLTNLRHLTELLHAHEARTGCHPLALCAWLAEQCRGDDVSGEEAELRLESDADAVQLVTIHRSKGLEYPVVYCPYLWKGRSDRASQLKFLIYHEPAAEWAGRLALFPDKGPQASQRREAFAEALRLLYVAITRAKHCCLIPWVGASTYHTSALAYLLHSRDLPTDDLDELTRQLKATSQAELFAQLGQRAAQEAGWSLRLLDPEERVQPMIREAGEATALYCPVPNLQQEHFWRIGSFSGLIAKATVTRPDAAHDYDEAAAVVGAEVALAGEVLLADFPKGATAGNFFHRLLELANFQAKAQEEFAPLVADQLRAFGFAAERWQQPVCAALQQMLAAPLAQNSNLALQNVAPEQRLHELPFLFPVCPDGAGEALRPQALAHAMAVEATGVIADYTTRLATLDFLPLAGYLKGFVDLVFMHQDRWYVVDYKSNHLGGRYQDYGQAALGRAMADHHYFLQYHLYSVALDRYLRLRLPGYDYDRHFGGVAYLFLKGMHPELPGSGVFFDRPPARRIRALGNLFAAAS